jgi:hypothetical protein
MDFSPNAPSEICGALGVGWVEALRNPTFLRFCWVSLRLTQPTFNALF